MAASMSPSKMAPRSISAQHRWIIYLDHHHKRKEPFDGRERTEVPRRDELHRGKLISRTHEIRENTFGERRSTETARSSPPPWSGGWKLPEWSLELRSTKNSC